MQSAATELKDIFEQASVAEAQIPVYANCTGEKYQGSYTDTMLRQIVSPILWQKSIENMIARRRRYIHRGWSGKQTDQNDNKNIKGYNYA